MGRALAATFEEAGGLFVKLGQAMASQPQLVTPAIAAELARLQDQAAPSDPGAAMRVVAEEIGPVDELFAEFGAEPVATASIGQTYFARLRNGSEVVKVQRPGIRPVVEGDLEILTRLAGRLERRTTWARALGMSELVAGFAQSTREELDFRIESTNGEDAAAALKDDDLIKVPAIMEDLTTSRLIVQERIIGRSIGAPGALAGITPAARKILADRLLELIVGLMLDGKRFHADPHPGNVFIDDAGRLALIDFGSVGRLNRFERLGLLDLFRGLRDEDPAVMRQAALRLGAAEARVDAEALDRELARVLTRAILPGDRFDPAAVGDMLIVFRDYGIRLPRSITALFRTLFTIMGTLDILSPGYDLIGAIKRLGRGIGGLGPSFGGVRDFVEKQVLTVGPALTRLPGDIDDLARSLLRGDVRTRVSLFSESENVRFVRGMVNRAILTAIGAVLSLGSILLLTAQGAADTTDALHAIGGLGLTFRLTAAAPHSRADSARSRIALARSKTLPCASPPLRASGGGSGGADGNRTRAICLGSRSSAIELQPRIARCTRLRQHNRSARAAHYAGTVLLSDRDIKAQLDAERIGLDPLDLQMVQPSSVDVRLDRYFRLFDNHKYPFIDPAQDQPDLTHLVEVAPDEAFILHPGEFVLGSTFERVTLPDDVAARLEGKSSLGRLGLLTHSTAGFIDPGFSGHVTLELSNVATLPIKLWPGMKIGQLCFFQLSSAAENAYGSGPYGNRYQGQRGPTASRSFQSFHRTDVSVRDAGSAGA